MKCVFIYASWPCLLQQTAENPVMNSGNSKCFDQMKRWHALAPAQNANCLLHSGFLIKKGQFVDTEALTRCFVISKCYPLCCWLPWCHITAPISSSCLDCSLLWQQISSVLHQGMWIFTCNLKSTLRMHFFFLKHVFEILSYGLKNHRGS